jgi:hypothetical protein
LLRVLLEMPYRLSIMTKRIILQYPK